MSKKKQRADSDSPWKQILEAYFPQAIKFFFPNTAATIDWEVPYEFLDKEFQAISRFAKQGKRYADKLVKVRLLSGKDTWLLIHIEIQAQKEDEFELRMFTYNFRILDRYKVSAISLAILCDSDKDWNPSTFTFIHNDTVQYFKFGTAKLLKYQRRWKQLEASDNIFTNVVMAHLKTQETLKKPGKRKEWKFALIRRLYEQGLDEQDIRNLYIFIDWVMILPKELENEFWEEFKQFEQERSMPYMTTGERIGYERGKEEGLVEGELSLVLRQLQRRLGQLSPNVRAQIESLTLAQLEALGEALLDFTGADDLSQWLQQNQS